MIVWTPYSLVLQNIYGCVTPKEPRSVGEALHPHHLDRRQGQECLDTNAASMSPKEIIALCCEPEAGRPSRWVTVYDLTMPASDLNPNTYVFCIQKVLPPAS